MIPKKVILDCDPGSDDAIAMMLKEGEAAAPKAKVPIQGLTEKYPLCI